MEKLRTYLKSLEIEERFLFAITVGTTLGYLAKAISVDQKLNAEVCTAIELETNKQVTRKDLRPNDWQRIWPELAEKDAA